MRRWLTDGSLRADSRYSALVRWLVWRGFNRTATVAKWVGL